LTARARSTGVSSQFPLSDLLRSVFRKSANDIAYLALTGNSESALRDRIALHLHQLPLISERGWVVAREFRPHRVDLAILGKGGHPIAVFEFKAGYSYDVLDDRKWTELHRKLERDTQKCRTLFELYPESLEAAYSLLFIAHPTVRIPAELDAIAGKYKRHM
jgi:hypothetical protein